MRIAPVAELKARLSAYLKGGQGPVIVTKNGKPVGVLIPVQDQEEIERLALAYSPLFTGILKKSTGQIAEGQGMTHGDFWREVETEHKA